MGTGWGRGGEARVGGRGGSPYNLRLLPKASGKDTCFVPGARIGPCRRYLGAMLALCSPMLASVGPMLALCWPMSALPWHYVLCRPKFALSCPYVDPMFAYVGLRNANPHSSDCETPKRRRWPRGGEDQGGGRGGTPFFLRFSPSVTYRRPPARTRASWPAPGFKGLRLTAVRRPKGGYVGPMFDSLAPISGLCWPYVRQC